MHISFSYPNLRYVHEAGSDNRTNQGIVGIDTQIFIIDAKCTDVTFM